MVFFRNDEVTVEQYSLEIFILNNILVGWQSIVGESDQQYSDRTPSHYF